ncbi:rhomboid family intramembrane serine protease [Paraburkholderia caballeronis]|uniref:rhomboid family intramembrane serine protease n=1 Tax=Paraburkholderia caballeronis TaxID=416943 RepID=UPI001064F86B|nr:rhomboid family intramembrane serine protease [Paraburkholderia caballeronis]TDV26836.1 rhomboid family protein [Paraburkholderia caballeronis]
MPQPSQPYARAAASGPDFATRLELRAALLASFVGSIWAVFIVSTAFPGLRLDSHGVRPRSFAGLEGILFAPWLHGNLAHIMANTGGLVILGWFTMWPRISGFWAATIGSMLGAGLFAWVLGAPDTIHIGASGIIFGYAGFLVARGWFTRNVLALVVAVSVMVFYGATMLVGVLPLYPFISWESHLGGVVGGVVMARVVSVRGAGGRRGR